MTAFETRLAATWVNRSASAMNGCTVPSRSRAKVWLADVAAPRSAAKRMILLRSVKVKVKVAR